MTRIVTVTPTTVCEVTGQISTGELPMCKKRKLNDSIKNTLTLVRVKLSLTI